MDWTVATTAMSKGCLVNFRPLLSMMSCLQFYPGLDIRKVDAGGSKSYWLSLKQGRNWQNVQVVLFYVHGGAFVGGNACMCGLTFQNWMQRMAATGVRAKVLSVEYPLAPEHTFPAALLDTAAAYTWLCQQLKGTDTSCIIPVADFAGANILVAALAALRDLESAKKQQQQRDKCNVSAIARAAAAAAALASAAGSLSAQPAAKLESVMADMFGNLDARLTKIHASSSSRVTYTASSSSSGGWVRSRADGGLDNPSPAGSSNWTTDLTVQICTASGDVDDSTAVAAVAAATAAAGDGGGVCFTPPAAVVLVSAAMDVSPAACFHDAAWIATHEPRFDYLPAEIVGGGMSHYVTDDELLHTGYVSPVYLHSLRGLVGSKWLLLAGGAELMGRDISKFAARLVHELGPAAVHLHIHPHMPHSWAIMPAPSLWPRQQLIVDFIAAQAAAAAAAAPTKANLPSMRCH